jgi:hypothetical protein
VATPLLLQWLNMVYNKNDYFQYLDSTMTLMFQKEVAEVNSFSLLKNLLINLNFRESLLQPILSNEAD